MSRFQELKESFKTRLLALTRRDLFGPFQRTISEYEEEVDRRRTLLDLVSDPERLRSSVFPVDVFMHEEKIPAEQQERSFREDPEDLAAAGAADGGGSYSDQSSGVSGCVSDDDHNSCKTDVKGGCRGHSKQHQHKHLNSEIETLCVNHHSVMDSGQNSLRFHMSSKMLRRRQQLRHGTAPKKPASCSMCGEIFGDRSLLAAHRKTHREKKMLACGLCGLQTRFRSQLQIHMRRHTGEKPYSCSICGKRFSQVGITKQHMLVHAAIKPFGCEECGRRFSWHFQVKKHKCSGRSSRQGWSRGSEPIRSRDPEGGSRSDGKTAALVQSDDSDGEFWRDTRQHRSRVTYQRIKKVSDADEKPPDNGSANSDFYKQTEPPPLSCEDAHTLQIHIRHVSKEKPYSCLFCGRGFTSTTQLTGHMSVHTGETPLRCAVCHRPFTTESELLNHECVVESSQVTADTDKAFGRFSQKQQIHLRRLGGERALGCSLCGKTFSTREGLRLHLRNHASRNSPTCSVCGARFTDTDSLVQHMRSHTRQTQFCCSLCGKDFAWRRHLIKHMELHKNRKFRRHDQLHWSPLVPGRDRPGPGPGPGPQHRSSQSFTPDDSDTERRDSDSMLGCDGDGKSSRRQSNDSDNSDFWKDGRDGRRDSTATKHHCQTSERDPRSSEMSSHSNPAETPLEENRLSCSSEAPQVKEEPEEAAIAMVTFSPVSVKEEQDEEKTQSQLLHRDSEGGPGPGPDLGDFKSGDSVDSDFWKETNRQRSDTTSEHDSPWSRCDGKASDGDNTDDSDFWKDDRKSEFGQSSSKHVTSAGKPCTCPECGEEFTSPSQLRLHIRGHSDERPLICSVCGQTCLYRSHLKIHMRTHTGEKPFDCPVCGKKYAHKASMQAHMSVHTVQEQYSCTVCQRSFAWFTELKYHRCVRALARKQM